LIEKIRTEQEILYRLYMKDNDYVKSFQILIELKSMKAFELFKVERPGFSHDQQLFKSFIQLLEIDPGKTVECLLQNKSGDLQKQAYID